jgi:hypothetical protein
MIMAFLVFLTPLAQAATVVPAVTYGPPFSGGVATAKLLQYQGCGLTAKITKGPKFTLTSGVEVLGQKTTATSCPSPLGYNWVISSGSAGMWTKTFHGVSGLRHIVVKWHVSWTSTITASLGPTFSGSAHASTFMAAVTYLVDETNLTYIGAANSWGAYSYIANGTQTLTPSAAVTIYLNQTLISSHVYAIATWIYGTTASWASSAGPSTASAILVLAGPGGTTHLISITRT